MSILKPKRKIISLVKHKGQSINQSISSPMNKSISQEWRKAQLFVKDYGFHLILKASIFCIPSAKTFELN